MTQINLDNPKIYEYLLSPDKQLTEEDQDTENTNTDDIISEIHPTKSNKNIILIIALLILIITIGYFTISYFKTNNIPKTNYISTHDTRIRISK